MHLPPANIRTANGFSRLPYRPLVAVDLTRAELHDLARLIERQADTAREERCDDAAERLDRRAADLREAAR